jgi:MOSC domain-containing protein YiiM
MGRLERIWVKRSHAGVMDPAERVALDADGIVGNADRGGRRAVTMISAERWRQAQAHLGVELDPATRRANLLVSGVDLVASRGRTLRIGSCTVRVNGETRPCTLMDELHPGLQDALDAGWGGGAYAEVVADGDIAVGDTVEWLREA